VRRRNTGVLIMVFPLRLGVFIFLLLLCGRTTNYRVARSALRGNWA